ncbi:uncharacterized protein LOC107864799 [Capsicum annuum]|uniref:uncharacterized protein LOC107864799 n=1 Tax=Capsicum annuum TaxID=4072 RepID=UPI001FB14352|nr:uncharacterized protein LOC107864799 [Capsicum annuum]
MTQGRGTGRGSIGHAGKSAGRSNILVLAANMPTISTPTVAPQTAGGIGEDVSRSNTNGEDNSSGSHVRTLVTIISTGLQPSKVYSNSIHESFKSELDHNRVNCKGVSCDIKDGYFGEFKKHFYWDSSISDGAVKKQWQSKAATVYRNFIAKIKENGIRQDFIPKDVWESWQQLWIDPKCVEKSKINVENRRGGKEVATGTHTGGSISIGEYRKRLERFEEICEKKHYQNLLLIKLKHITKLPEEKRSEEYLVLDLKPKATTGKLFVFLVERLHLQLHMNWYQLQIQNWMCL